MTNKKIYSKRITYCLAVLLLAAFTLTCAAGLLACTKALTAEDYKRMDTTKYPCPDQFCFFLTHEESMKNLDKVYTAQDFPYLKNVDHLTDDSNKKDNWDVDNPDFKRRMEITLTTQDLDLVYKAIARVCKDKRVDSAKTMEGGVLLSLPNDPFCSDILNGDYGIPIGIPYGTPIVFPIFQRPSKLASSIRVSDGRMRISSAK